MGDLPVMLEKADQLIDAGNSFLAKKLIADMLQQEPENPWVFIIRGKLQLSLKEFTKARADLFSALRLQPENPAAFYLLAMVEMEAGDKTAGYGWICRALEKEPENPDFLGLKSILLLDAYEQQTESWTAALDGLSIDPLNRNCLAAAYFSLTRLGREAEATDHLRIALATYPDDPQFLSMFSRVLLKAGEQEEARETILSALRKIPGAEQYQAQLELVQLNGQTWYRNSMNILLKVYSFPIKIPAIIASILWMGGIYAIVGHYHPVIHIGVLSCWFLAIIFGFPWWLHRLSIVTGLLTRVIKNTSKRYNLLANGLLMIIGLLSMLAGILSFFVNGVMKEGWLSLGCTGWILFYPAVRLQQDIEGKKAARYIRHNWLCILLSFLLLLLIILFPIAGYEITYIGTFLFISIFYWIRNRWEFDEKYDLSKTLTAHE